MIWNKEAESMRVGERQKLQLERMKAILKRTYKNVPYYKKRFDEMKVKPGDIKSLKDIQKLPFTTKTDLREGYPFGLFAVPRREIIEVHTSSGTTGKPTVSGYTRKDIEIWGEVMARALTMCGATKDDIIQNGYGYGLFTGGLGVHYGAQRIGATVVPVSAGQTKRHLDIMQDFGSTILTCTPSYALYLTEAVEEAGINIKKLKLKAGCFGAEVWTDRMRDEIEKRFHLIALNIYGLTEIIGPGVAQECDQKNGLHIAEDHFYPEVV